MASQPGDRGHGKGESSFLGAILGWPWASVWGGVAPVLGAGGHLVSMGSLADAGWAGALAC